MMNFKQNRIAKHESLILKLALDLKSEKIRVFMTFFHEEVVLEIGLHKLVQKTKVILAKLKVVLKTFDFNMKHPNSLSYQDFHFSVKISTDVAFMTKIKISLTSTSATVNSTKKSTEAIQNLPKKSNRISKEELPSNFFLFCTAPNKKILVEHSQT